MPSCKLKLPPVVVAEVVGKGDWVGVGVGVGAGVGVGTGAAVST